MSKTQLCAQNLLFDREHGSSELQPKKPQDPEAKTNYLMRLITLGGGLLIPEQCAALKFSLRLCRHFLLLVNLTKQASQRSILWRELDRLLQLLLRFRQTVQNRICFAQFFVRQR